MDRLPFLVRKYRRYSLALLLAAVAVIGSAVEKSSFRPNSKAAFADPRTASFVRPGLVIRISSAELSAERVISVTFSITDPRSLPLDREGITTPGAVALSFVAAYIPAGQQQYVAYTTRQATGMSSGTVTQAAADTGGTYTKIADGQYRYVFGTRAPAGYNPAATHTIGIYGSRNLTEFELGTNYASTTFNFVPAGGPVTTVRDVIRSPSCNRCHDEIAAHGGSRRGVEMCVLCHTPQTSDPDTGNTVDFPVMIHKIHAGRDLPSVKSGKPYRIIGFGGSVLDWSTVAFPSDIRRCDTCHQQSTGAAQATANLTRPSRVACGSCHDDVNFATGEGHAGGPQVSDNQCANCHIPQGELDFDASVRGAHMVPQDSEMLGGLQFELLGIADTAPGRNPVVSFTVKDKKGASVALSTLNNLSLVMAGPTSEYGFIRFGTDVTTPGYVSEDARTATCTADGSCAYTFRHAIPEGAHGSFSVGIEGRRTETLLPGTTSQRSVQYGGPNKVLHFTVDGSPVEARRQVVATAQCNQCHTKLTAHGQNRNEVAMCVLCHNPSLTDSARRPTAQTAADREQPAQGVNFNLLIHRIHTGEHLNEAGRSYVVVGFGGSHNDFSEVRYPAMSPGGAPGDRRNCSMCHVNGSEQNLSLMTHDVQDPQGPIPTVKPITSACTGCHVSMPAASHALINTSAIGESCEVCHGSGSQFSVGKSHAQ